MENLYVVRNGVFLLEQHHSRRLKMSQIPFEEYQQRIEQAREKMRVEGLDALFIYADHYRCMNTSYFIDYRPMDCTLNAAGAVFIPLEKELLPTVS